MRAGIFGGGVCSRGGSVGRRLTTQVAQIKVGNAAQRTTPKVFAEESIARRISKEDRKSFFFGRKKKHNNIQQNELQKLQNFSQSASKQSCQYILFFLTRRFILSYTELKAKPHPAVSEKRGSAAFHSSRLNRKTPHQRGNIIQAARHF